MHQPHPPHDPSAREHWERVYASRPATAVSWYQERATVSLQLITDASCSGIAITAHDPIIDVGGGASLLVRDLWQAGYRDLSVLDLSATALEAAQAQLGAPAEEVHWITADVLSAELPTQHYAVWHDRAVFHFLTEPEDRVRYVQQVLRAVRPGGLVIVATFAEDGPRQCSGLPVMRYTPEQLHANFGSPFELLGHERETHHTPGGGEQAFVYCFWRRGRSAAPVSP